MLVIVGSSYILNIITFSSFRKSRNLPILVIFSPKAITKIISHLEHVEVKENLTGVPCLSCPHPLPPPQKKIYMGRIFQ